MPVHGAGQVTLRSHYREEHGATRGPHRPTSLQHNRPIYQRLQWLNELKREIKMRVRSARIEKSKRSSYSTGATYRPVNV